MLSWILIAFVVSSIVALFKYLLICIPHWNWIAPAALFCIAGVSILFEKFFIKKTQYRGIGDLFFHILEPKARSNGVFWYVRAIISYLLAIFGGVIGPEGAAIELSEAIRLSTRPRSLNWFEQRRRTDVATSIAIGFSVAFGVPFSAVLFPIELGVGGQSFTTIIGALFGFVFIRTISSQFNLSTFSIDEKLVHFNVFDFQSWIMVGILTCVCSIVGIVLVKLIRYVYENLDTLFQSRNWIRTLIGAILLVGVYFVHPQFHQNPSYLLDQVFAGQYHGDQIALFSILFTLSLALTLSTFGTVGILWPIFTIGGLIGYYFYHNIFYAFFKNDLSSGLVLGLVGGSALWGSTLGTPIAAAVLACELTKNFQVFLPCVVAGVVAQGIRRIVHVKTLLESDLESRGSVLVEGKSASILDSLKIEELMVKDHESASEGEVASELQNKFLNSRYPFLPIVSSKGIYRGLLTLDMLKNEWGDDESRGAPESIKELLVARDFLAKFKVDSPPVQLGDRLSDLIQYFDQSPCLTVLDHEGRVLGLLLIYHVRLGYEREVMRRSVFRT